MRLSTKLPKFNKKVARIAMLSVKQSIDRQMPDVRIRNLLHRSMPHWSSAQEIDRQSSDCGQSDVIESVVRRRRGL